MYFWSKFKVINLRVPVIKIVKFEKLHVGVAEPEPQGAETFGRIRSLSFGSRSDKISLWNKIKQDHASNLKSVFFQKSRKLDFFS